MSFSFYINNCSPTGGPGIFGGRLKKQFEKTEYFPLLLVYPEGVLSSEILIALIEKIKGLNFGIEPMLPNMAIPYQGLLSR